MTFVGKTWKLGTAALLGAGLLTTLAPAATAAPAIPASAQSCSGNTCMYLSTPNSSGNVTVEGWAYSTTFYGYFQFTGPQGLNKVAGPATWYGGKGNYAYIVNPAIVGKYCVHAYLPGGYSEGTVCNYVK